MDVSLFESRATAAEAKIEQLLKRLQLVEQTKDSQAKPKNLELNERTFIEFPSIKDAVDFVSKGEKWWLFGNTWKASVEGNTISVQYYPPLSPSDLEKFKSGKNQVPESACRFDQFYMKQMNMFGTIQVKISHSVVEKAETTGEKTPSSSLKTLRENQQKQADYVRKLKQEKADKDLVKKEVEKLLQIKAEVASLEKAEGLDASPEPKQDSKPKSSGKQQKVRENKGKKEEGEFDDTILKDNYGVLPLIQSRDRPSKQFSDIGSLNTEKSDQSILVRARVHTSRKKGNLLFLVLRQSFSTIQATLSKSEQTPKEMIDWCGRIPKESIVDVEGTLVTTNGKVESVSQQDVEISVTKIFVVTKADPLPIQIEDCARPKTILDEQDMKISVIEREIEELKKELESKQKDSEKKKIAKKIEEKQNEKSRAEVYPKVGRDIRLDNRILDLRTPANQAILRVSTGVCQLFRDYLLSHNFVEIHSPKLIGCASEGGAQVFKLKYFDSWAFLAQSPQLYKQMGICADLGRVFEVGPVFRAENSNTHRHLCEFTGLDLEMSFNEHYHEVLEVIDGLFFHIFEGLNKNFQKELGIINQQYPFEPLKYKYPALRLEFPQAVALLREAGIEMGDFEDLSTENEKKLGGIVKEKYDTDFFILDKFPLGVRPFYTMPDPQKKNYSNSYDIFIRGEEIMSGAQRVHDPKLLIERAKECGVGIEGIKDYVDSFRYGALPHGGGGIGLERVVMLFLGLKNIREISMFPRDPQRLTP